MNLVVRGSSPLFYLFISLLFGTKSTNFFYLNWHQTKQDLQTSYLLNIEDRVGVSYTPIKINSKRTLRFILTLLYSHHPVLTLTFRKHLLKSLKFLNLRYRWGIQTFFLFKYASILFGKNQSTNFLFFFFKPTSFMLNNILTFHNNYLLFFKDLKSVGLYILFANFYFFNRRVYKHIKSIKKFRQKIFFKTNNRNLQFLNFKKNL